MSRKIGMLAAGFASVVALLAVSASAREVVTRENGVTRVDAPTTRVRVDESSGATTVRVRAPAARVDVDTDDRQVRIRVPYFKGDIRW